MLDNIFKYRDYQHARLHLHYGEDDNDPEISRDLEYDVNVINYKCGCSDEYNGYWLRIIGKTCKKHEKELIDYLYSGE